MAYSVKGQFGEYDFEDDVPLETAVKVVKNLDKPAETLDVLAAAPKAALGHTLKGVAGIGQLISETVPVPDVVENASTKLLESSQRMIEEATPKNMTTGQEMLFSGVASAASALPAIAAGVLTRSPGVTLALMGGTVGGEKYAESRQAGLGVGRSAVHGLFHGGVEAATESIPLKALMTSKPLVDYVVNFLKKEVGTEMLATALQDLNDKMSTQPDMTLGQWLKDVFVMTPASVLVGAPLQVGAGRLLQKTVEAVNSKKPLVAAESPIPQAAQETPTEKTEETPTEKTEETPLSFTPRDKRQSGYILGEELIPEGLDKTSPEELPFDLRIERLQQLLTTSPGPTATAEDLVKRNAAIRDLRSSIENELVTNPEQRAILTKADIELGIRVPDMGAQLEITQGEARTLKHDELLRALKEEPHSNEQVEMPKGEELAADFNLPNSALVPSIRKAEYSTQSWFPKVDELVINTANDNALVGKTVRDVWQNGPDGSVVLAGVPLNDTRNSGVIFDVFSQWAKAFMPDRKLVIAFEKTPGEFHPGMTTSYASYASYLPNNTVFFLVPYFENALDETIATAAHEFGHALIYDELGRASLKTQRDIYQSYLDLLERSKTLKFRDFLSEFMSPVRAERVAKTSDKETLEANTLDVLRRFPATTNGTFFSYNEFLAEQTARYFYSRTGLTPEGTNVFKKIIRRLVEFFNKGARKFMPEVSFARFMDGILLRNSSLAQLTTPDEVKEMKNRLLSLGVQPAIVESLNEVGSFGYDMRTAARLAMQLESRTKTRSEIYEKEVGQWMRQVEVVSKLARSKMTSMSTSSAKALLKDALGQEYHELIDDMFLLPQFQTQKIDKTEVIKTLFTQLNNLNAQISEEGIGTVIKYTAKTSGTKLGTITIFADEVPMIHLLSDTNYSVNDAMLLFDAMQRVSGLGATQASLSPNLLPAAEALGFKVEENRIDIPVWLFPKEEKPPILQAALPTAFNNAINRLGLHSSSVSSIPRDLVKFNRATEIGLGAFQILKLNEGVPGANEFRQALRNRMRYKAEWTRRADSIVKDWLYEIPKEQADKLSKLLFDESYAGDELGAAGWMSEIFEDPANPGEFIFKLKDEFAKKYGIDEKTAELYSRIRNAFRLVLDDQERIGISEIARIRFGADSPIAIAAVEGMRKRIDLASLRLMLEGAAQKDPQLFDNVKEDLAKLKDGFDSLRQKPYMPYARFGQWAVVGRNKSGQVEYMTTFETRAARDKEFMEVTKSKDFADLTFKVTYIEDVPYMFQGMPPQFLDIIAKRLELSPEQLEQYKKMLVDMSSSRAFIKRLKHRKGIKGFSEDALRVFADYFRRYANYTAIVKSNAELLEAMRQLEGYIKHADNPTNARRLHQWMQETKDYLQNPQNELSELKSLVSAFYIAGNVSSAVINTLQVPLVTLPYLSERFGITRSLNELRKAYKDILRGWKDFSTFSQDEIEAINEGLSAQFLDESYATTLAQLADGVALTKAQPVSSARSLVNSFNHYAMLPFQKAEELNRRVTFLAAYRMARQGTAFDRDAFSFAQSVVEDTQNEYSIENRPGFMRGNKSLIFQFMHYQQNMLFQMLGGDKSWWRLLLVQLAMGGFLGLPFAEDLINLTKFLARKVGLDFEPEVAARQYLLDMGINADLILRGATSNVFGFDLSHRLSLGEVIPGMKTLGSNQKFQDAMYYAVGDVGGAGISILLNLMKFVGDDDPNTIRRWQNIMPTSVKNIMKAAQAFESGGVESRNGAMLAETSVFEEIGMSIGFLPKDVSDAYRAISLEQEIAAFWINRRSALLAEWNHIVDKRGMDSDAVGAFMERLQAFNADAPDPKLYISRETLRRSAKMRAKAQALQEQGYGAHPATRNLTKEIESLYGR